MKRLFLSAILFLAACNWLVVSSGRVTARPVKIWTQAELVEQADLVLIGKAVSTADAKNHAYPDAKPTTWVAVDTVFQVESILKGKVAGKSVSVRYHRYYDTSGTVGEVNGPVFIRFNSQLDHRYLIYLKKKEAGEYEPLTGQYDPDHSFFKLTPYLPADEQKKKEETPAKAIIPHGPHPESVSLVNLISNPEKYDGKFVAVRGFLALDFEGCAIYLHQEDYENGISKNGLWCSIDLVKYKEFDHKYVSLSGTFSAKEQGHLGLWSGTINEVQRAWSPSEGKNAD